MTNSKRHYRVVQRDKETLGDQLTCHHKNIKEFMFIGVLIYLISVTSTYFLGYFMGKNN